MKYLRIFVGLTAWIVSGVMLCVWMGGYLFDEREDGHRVAAELWEFASAERILVKLQLDRAWPLAVGDPIYRVDGPDSIEQVGEIRRLVPGEDTKQSGCAAGPAAEALVYPNAPPICAGSFMEYYATPRSMTWVMDTMLPAEKRLKIAREIVATYETYHAEILDAVKPIVLAGLFDAMRVVEGDLARAVARRRDQLERLGSRYQNGVIQKEIVPLVREEIWPIVRQHAEPLAEQIGEEMFARASLWGFSWRLVYDMSFLPEKNLTQAEWNRFIEEEGIPILNSHSSDFVAVQRDILENIAENQKVRDAVRHHLTQIIDDPEFRAIVWQVFREVVVDNPRLREKLEQRWSTAEARRAVQLAADYVEPCVRRIGDLLFGTRRDGIAPEFAQVLRNQILDKDCRWLVITTPPDSMPRRSSSEKHVLRVRHGGYPDVNPFAVQLQGGL